MAYGTYEYKYPNPVHVKLADGSEFSVTVTYKEIRDPARNYAAIDKWVELGFPNGLPERQKKLLDQYFLGQSYELPLWVHQVLESRRRELKPFAPHVPDDGIIKLKPAQRLSTVVDGMSVPDYVPQSVPEAERPFNQITHDVACNLPVPSDYETLWTNILNLHPYLEPSHVAGGDTHMPLPSIVAAMRDVFGIPVEQTMRMTRGELKPYEDAIATYALLPGNNVVLLPGDAEILKTKVQEIIGSYNTSPEQPADSGTPSEPSNPSPPSQPSEGSEGEGAFNTEAGQGNVSKIRFAFDPATSTRIGLAGRGIPFQGNIPLVNQAGSSAGFTYYNPNQNDAVNKYVDQLFANITKQATPQSGGASITSPLFGMSAKPIAPLFNPSSSSEQNQTPESQSTQSTQQQNKSPIWNRYWDQHISKATDALVPWLKGNQKSVFSWR